MKLISFDIGICNLAYAYANCDENNSSVELIEWSLLPLRNSKEKKDFSEITTKLVDVLNEKFWNLDIDVVLIENQPVMKNPVMKTLQIIIYTFFLLKNKQKSLNSIIKLVSAQSKLKVKEKDNVDCSHITTTNKYKRNKELSIEYAKYYLSFTKQEEKWCNYFENTKKTDDISETFLYILNYLNM